MLHKMGAGLYAKLMAEVDAHVGAQLTLLAVRAPVTCLRCVAASAALTRPGFRRTPRPTRWRSWRAWTRCGRTTRRRCTRYAVRPLWLSRCLRCVSRALTLLRCRAGIFLVLDRTYVLPQPGVRPLWDEGLAKLRTHLSARPALAARAVRGLLAAVERERAGEGPAARPLLKSLTRLLSALVRHLQSSSSDDDYCSNLA